MICKRITLVMTRSTNKIIPVRRPSQRGPVAISRGYPVAISRGYPVAMRGFTLTEILIALALIVILLIGVSQVFTLTSSTISQGQAFSTALRTQRAVGQMLSNDILGFASTTGDRQDLANDDLVTPSGMRPLAPIDPDERAPYLVISNARIAAYLDKNDEASDSTPPTATTFAPRSLDIRTQDGVTVPIYIYGNRNFRIDQISFFGRGAFTKQTGNINGFGNGSLFSNDALLWFGHLRTFNGRSVADVDNISDAYGQPGALETSGGQPNSNNRYAGQFSLGRAQLLLVEPNTASGRFPIPVVYDDNFTPQHFVFARWAMDGGGSSTALSPFNTSSFVAAYDTRNTTTLGDDVHRYVLTRRNLSTDGNTEQLSDGTNSAPNAQLFPTSGGTPPDNLTINHARTDALGVSRAQALARFVTVAPGLATWWQNLMGGSHNFRFTVNPFPSRPFNPKKMGQRSQLLAEACTQFIVEFAGDFMTQNASGTVTGTAPDGVIDFLVVGGQRQVRWFGLPRDVNGDGTINAPSGDVVPVRDVRGAQAFFEKIVPAQVGNYASVIAEPGTNVDASGYICAWSPLNMDPTNATNWNGVPSMLRIIVELRDPEGKLTQPVTQEYVYRIPQ